MKSNQFSKHLIVLLLSAGLLFACSDDSGNGDDGEDTGTEPADSNTADTTTIDNDTGTVDPATKDTTDTATQSTAQDTGTNTNGIDTTAILDSASATDWDTTAILDSLSDSFEIDTATDTTPADTATDPADTETANVTTLPDMPECAQYANETTDSCEANGSAAATSQELCDAAECAVCALYNGFKDSCGVIDCGKATQCLNQYNTCMSAVNCSGNMAVVGATIAICWSNWSTCQGVPLP